LLLAHGWAISQDSGVTLRSTTRLIQITVVAQDAKGHPLTDLRREQFTLLDGRNPREIRVFTVDRKAEHPVSNTPVPAPSAERVYTNTGAERSGPNGVTVILLDSLNTKWTDQSRAIKTVTRFLSQIQPDDHIAIYSIGLSGFRVLHDFTTDASDLVARLASWNGEIPRPKSSDPGDIGAQLATVLSGTDRAERLNQRRAPQADADVSGATLMTLSTFASLANRLAGIPGRKNLIWVSDGFPLLSWGYMDNVVFSPTMVKPVDIRGEDPSTAFQRESDRTMHLLDGANVAVYPIEARGLLMYWHGAKGPGTTLVAAHDEATEQAMEEIAQRTGGRAFVRSNDILGAIRTAAGDSRVSYTLGFYPEPRFDGRFHPITVKLAGRSGVALRYRSGYIDEPDVPNDPRKRKSELEAASLSPLDANAIPLTARLTPSSNSGAYHLSLTIGPFNLNLRLVGGTWAGDLDVMLVQRDGRGKEFGRANDTISLRLKEPTYEQVLKTGIPYQRDVTLNPNAKVLRLVVRDSAAGNVGSLTVPAKDLAR
jgi:VWFA-related protein